MKEYGLFRQWARQASGDRVQLTDDAITIEIDYLADPTGSTEKLDCTYAAGNFRSWQNILPRSPFAHVDASYRAMLRTFHNLIGACEAGHPWSRDGVPAVERYFTRLRQEATSEGRYLSLNYERAQRYGVAWEWPTAFSTNPQYALGV